MKGIIKIENKKLKYQNDKREHSHAYFKTKSFEIDIDNIAVIGVYYTLIIDDEYDILVIIDKRHKKHFISFTYDLETESYSKLLSFFNINNDFVTKERKEYEKGNSYVLYPKELNGNNLYRKRNFFLRIVSIFSKILKLKKIAEGELTKEIKTYINNMK